MIKEIISKKTITTKLTVTNSQITAVLKSEDAKTGLRLYSDGCIGIAGAIGCYDEAVLMTEAENMLKYKIPYDCDITENICRIEDLTNISGYSSEKFIEISESVLSELRLKYPSFMFSNEIVCTEDEVSIKNSLGADLLYKDRQMYFAFIIKNRGSKNLFDGQAIHLTRNLDFDDFYKISTEFCDHYDEKIDLEKECKMPVVLLYDHEIFLEKFITDLNGKQIGTNTSLFSDKLGQKLFSDDFSLYIDRDPLKSYSCFFDGEGVTLSDKKFMLIENGVLKAPYSGKRTAKKYNLPITSSASMIYDAVPDTAPDCIKAASGDKTIKQLLDGRKAIYINIASGGDFTAQGEYATPVQAAYIFDGEKIYGRLPQIAVSSNVFDMFGKDFIGISTDGNIKNCPFKYMVTNMNVKKIGEHI